MTVVRVVVTVSEDGVEVGTTDIGYFEGQPYSVQIVTPDGVDHKIERVASPSLCRCEPKQTEPVSRFAHQPGCPLRERLA